MVPEYSPGRYSATTYSAVVCADVLEEVWLVVLEVAGLDVYEDV
ncbi:MAG: hypothetical protein QW835_03125 [Candidatus Hadarchaeum sp.]